jgi:predicted glycosyltransferase involved in capsule biosynthesis
MAQIFLVEEEFLATIQKIKKVRIGTSSEKIVINKTLFSLKYLR